MILRKRWLLLDGSVIVAARIFVRQVNRLAIQVGTDTAVLCYTGKGFCSLEARVPSSLGDATIAWMVGWTLFTL